jgi:hypothetical protein
MIKSLNLSELHCKKNNNVLSINLRKVHAALSKNIV